VTGEDRKGNVVAFLWDLFDSMNDPDSDKGLDVITYSPEILKNWQRNYTSFSDFFDSFPFPSADAQVLEDLRAVNGLD
jgi:hypothetical protein